MNFIHEPNRIFLLDDNNGLLAEVTFPNIDTGIVNINHTYVNESLRGQGIAGKLMESVVNELKKQNKKAILTCSYAMLWFERHPEYKGLIKA